MNEQSELIFKNRYAIDEKETWEQAAIRIGSGIASIENNKSKYSDIFSDNIYNMYFLPAGRILRNVGRPRGTLFNCYSMNVDDTIEDIAYTCAKALILWSEGGGVGFNFSDLRPENAPIIQKGGESSGPLSFMKFYDSGADCIKTGGARRAAALGLMTVNHPDIEKFIDFKSVDGVLTNFNISVGVTENFLESVEKNEDWDLTFNLKKYKTLNARELWNKILLNMVNFAEPGIINWDNLRSNNSWYFSPITGVNPCGEAVLSNEEVCCLGSLVLPKFITGNKNTNWKLMEEVIYNAVRFLDNTIHVNKYILEGIRKNAFASRRIGLGVMGLAEYLFSKKIKYGSPESIRHINILMENIRNFAYEASIKISEEKEPFEKFDPILYSKSHFIRTLPARIRKSIKTYGIRNVTALALAPTGTISLLAGVTGSIEPLPFKAYERNDQIGKRAYIHDIYKNIITNNESTPDWYVDSNDLKPEDHFEVQSACQKFVDGAVSKTINVPNEFKVEQLNDLLLEYIRDLKGVTIYRDGSREGQILVPITKKKAKEYLEKDMIDESQEEMQCATGSCDI